MDASLPAIVFSLEPDAVAGCLVGAGMLIVTGLLYFLPYVIAKSRWSPHDQLL